MGPTAINVWHACGRYGYLIPWAEWMATFNLWPTGHARHVRGEPFVYLWSDNGQESGVSVSPAKWEGPVFKGAMRSVCLDEFVDPGDAVRWDDLARACVYAANPNHPEQR